MIGGYIGIISHYSLLRTCRFKIQETGVLPISAKNLQCIPISGISQKATPKFWKPPRLKSCARDPYALVAS